MIADMKKDEVTMTHRQQWEQICSQQGWDDETKLTHLLGFIDDIAMGKYLVTYAQAAANEEDAQTKLSVLEEVGYSVIEDVDQPGMYLWIAPSDGSDISFSTRSEAIASAWLDAVQQTRSIADLSEGFFASLTLAQQCEVVSDNLAGG